MEANPAMRQVWTQEIDEETHKLYLEGHSTSLISEKLREKGFYFSRNAVIGRISRKGWNGRASKAPSITRPKPERKINLNKSSKPLPPPKGNRERDEPPLNIEIYDLGKDTCRWPAGDQAPYTYCGCRIHEGSVYCGNHTRMSMARYAD